MEPAPIRAPENDAQWLYSENERKLRARLEPHLEHARKMMLVSGAAPAAIDTVIVQWAVQDLVRHDQDRQALAHLLRSLAETLDAGR